MGEWLVQHRLITRKVNFIYCQLFNAIKFRILLEFNLLTKCFCFVGGSNYPGVVTDLIREVRDAGRIRDESLMNRVKALIDEKSWTANESNMRVLRELEEIKVINVKSCYLQFH